MEMIVLAIYIGVTIYIIYYSYAKLGYFGVLLLLVVVYFLYIYVKRLKEKNNRLKEAKDWFKLFDECISVRFKKMMMSSTDNRGFISIDHKYIQILEKGSGYIQENITILEDAYEDFLQSKAHLPKNKSGEYSARSNEGKKANQDKSDMNRKIIATKIMFSYFVRYGEFIRDVDNISENNCANKDEDIDETLIISSLCAPSQLRKF